jgi:hypothetical protein
MNAASTPLRRVANRSRPAGLRNRPPENLTAPEKIIRELRIFVLDKTPIERTLARIIENCTAKQ